MKPSIPRGTRDFSPVEMVRRNYIFDTIRNVFQKFGYQPIETPAMENIETLTGKYGDEGDQLLFKILNSRQYEAKNKNELLSEFERSLEKNTNSVLLTERALRYDLTVPFARYVVQHKNEITFPFKRYQIQPVWRADKPQKGRYREFYQCDADVIGSNSLLNEVELLKMIDDVFSKLNISVTIKINNRKILAGIAEIAGEKDKAVEIITAIDKLDKIGEEGVVLELQSQNISSEAIEKIKPLFNLKSSNEENLQLIKTFIQSSETGTKGVEEVFHLFELVKELELNNSILLDLSLARGLNYYTGAIFEVKANDVQIGSICGGGRYDNLTGIFGLPDVSGVGVSFGIDRIFDVMNELNLFANIDYTSKITKVLIAHFGHEEQLYGLRLANELRKEGINTELYPDVTKKIAKQFDYANKNNIPFVIVIGSDEMNSGILTFKNMSTGTQEKLSAKELAKKLK